jgi:signal transduction histidine kinase
MSKIDFSSEEKVKPFRLVKYFAFISLIIIFLGTVMLSLLNTHSARAMKRKESEEYALLLIENLNHQVFIQFALPVALRYGKIQLRNKEQFEHLDKVVRATLHSFKVETVNIFDLNNVISYSFDKDKIGSQNMGGAAYKSALEGTSTTKMIQRGNVIELLLGLPIESKLITFAPLRAEKPLSRISGPVLGVVEIVQDLSEENKRIFSFQVRVLVTSTIVMGVLFVVLIFVVKRGEGIIEKRAQERLRLKEKLSMAEKLSSLGELVAGISHEIRNPLGIIKSSADLMKKKLDPAHNANPIADIIVEESGRLNDILTDFLNYARPRMPDKTTCRIEDIIDKNISFLRSELENSGFKIEIMPYNGLKSIEADANMLYQAFLNLIINAMQSMPDGGIIRIFFEPKDTGITVRIEDEGGGIPNEILNKIWDPFFTTKETGTGLGLGIVKNIIELHGGQLKAFSNDDGGASVEIFLPESQEA